MQMKLEKPGGRRAVSIIYHAVGNMDREALERLSGTRCNGRVDVCGVRMLTYSGIFASRADARPAATAAAAMRRSICDIGDT